MFVQKKRHRRGFSLIELLIVVTVLAIIGAVSALAVTTQMAKSRDSKRKGHINQLHKLTEEYYTQFNVYPEHLVIPGDPGSPQNAVEAYEVFRETLAQHSLKRLTDVKDPLNKDPYFYTYTYPFPAGGTGYCLCARMERDNGNSGENCTNVAVNQPKTHFCLRSIQ